MLGHVVDGYTPSNGSNFVACSTRTTEAVHSDWYTFHYTGYGPGQHYAQLKVTSPAALTRTVYFTLVCT